MRRVHQDPDGTHGCHDEKDEQLESINYHRHVFPIFSRLQEFNKCSTLTKILQLKILIKGEYASRKNRSSTMLLYV